MTLRRLHRLTFQRSSCTRSTFKKKEEPKKEPPKKDDAKKAPPPDIPKIILHKIDIQDIGAGVIIHGVRLVGTIRFHPKIGGIEFPDIQRDVFGGKEDLTPGQTVACVISATAKKIFKMVAVELPKEIARRSVEGGKALAGAAVNSVKGGVASVGRGLRGAARRLSGRHDPHALDSDHDHLNDSDASPPGSPAASIKNPS